MKSLVFLSIFLTGCVSPSFYKAKIREKEQQTRAKCHEIFSECRVYCDDGTGNFIRVRPQ